MSENTSLFRHFGVFCPCGSCLCSLSGLGILDSDETEEPRLAPKMAGMTHTARQSRGEPGDVALPLCS